MLVYKILKNIQLELSVCMNFLLARKHNASIPSNSVFSIIAISLSICALIVVLSVMEGFGDVLQKRIIGIGSHIQVQKFGVDKSPGDTIETIRKQEYIKAVTPYVIGQSLLYYGRETNLTTVYGIDRISESKVSMLNEYIISGNLNFQNDGVIIGRELASKDSYDIGDNISLINPHTFQKYNFIVRGIYFTGMYAYDTNAVFMDIKTAQDLFKHSEGITGYKVMLEKNHDIESVKNELQQLLGLRYDVNTWIDLNKSLIGALNTEKRIMFLIMSIMIVIAGFNISSTLIMTVMDKTKEIGVLKAVGFSSRECP